MAKDTTITKETLVSQLLEEHPALLGVFVRHGFNYLRDENYRRALAQGVTVGQLAQSRIIPPERLVEDLNEALATGQPDAAPSGAPSTGQAVSMEDVMEMLKTCYDPEIPVNIVDLGLIYDVELQGDGVDVTMTLTAIGCPVGPYMASEVQAKLESLPGIRQANVRLVFDPPWTPDRMSEEARMELGIF